MNARLAARLTGWKIDITSDTQFAQQEAEAAFGGNGAEGEDFSGRCAAILSNGKRCPNEALPGTRYCGLPAHQELAGKEDQLPADAPEETPVATEAEAEQLAPVARIEEPAGEAILPPDPEVPAPEAERADPDPVPAGVPLERGPVDEQVETPVDVTGGAGLERTTDTDVVHAPRVEGGVDPGDQRI